MNARKIKELLKTKTLYVVNYNYIVGDDSNNIYAIKSIDVDAINFPDFEILVRKVDVFRFSDLYHIRIKIKDEFYMMSYTTKDAFKSLHRDLFFNLDDLKDFIHNRIKECINIIQNKTFDQTAYTKALRKL